MRCQAAVMVRSAALRSSALSFAKTCSIGLCEDHRAKRRRVIGKIGRKQHRRHGIRRGTARQSRSQRGFNRLD